MTNFPPRALFVCIHNAGRSQMAQAFWQRAGGDARSAGSQPAATVNPMVVEAMRECGVDLAGRAPHLLEREDAEWADVVVSMGCGDACPVIPGKRYVAWDLDDPAGRDLDTVRRIRDRIASLVGELAARERGSAAG